jgi:hypothetical protein
VSPTNKMPYIEPVARDVEGTSAWSRLKPISSPSSGRATRGNRIAVYHTIQHQDEMFRPPREAGTLPQGPRSRIGRCGITTPCTSSSQTIRAEVRHGRGDASIQQGVAPLGREHIHELVLATKHDRPRQPRPCGDFWLRRSRDSRRGGPTVFDEYERPGAQE